MEFTSADIFQHSPLGNVLDSLRSLSLSGESWPNYVRLEWKVDNEEIRSPPTTHLIATVDDLTDMLDFDSEDIDGMDDDAGEEQEPPPTGRWTATLSHDIYTWWIHPKKTTATMKIQSRINLLTYSQSTDVSSATLSHAAAKIATPSQEKIKLRTLPKTMKTP